MKDVKALERAEKKALENYHARAAELTKRREEAGKRLANAVTEEMQTLAMKGARMETALVPNPPSASGSERCEFLIAGHAGVQTRSLQKVASGGELARISSGESITQSALDAAREMLDECEQYKLNLSSGEST